MLRAVNAKRAASMLGVKPASLYAYVSRGLIKPVGKDAKRQSLFKLSDVEKLKAKSRARSGSGAVAAEALRWGDPVLESGIINHSHHKGRSGVPWFTGQHFSGK